MEGATWAIWEMPILIWAISKRQLNTTIRRLKSLARLVIGGAKETDLGNLGTSLF